MEQGFGMLGDALATGFASIFNKDIKFDFKKMIGGFLAALGDMMLRIGAAELTAGILMNIATPGAGATKMIGGGKMLAFGAALKGGGMAMSANGSLGASTQRNTGGGASNGPGFGSGGLNITFNPVVLEAQGSALKGAIDVANYKFG
jgi:hypothetical protein